MKHLLVVVGIVIIGSAGSMHAAQNYVQHLYGQLLLSNERVGRTEHAGIIRLTLPITATAYLEVEQDFNHLAEENYHGDSSYQVDVASRKAKKIMVPSVSARLRDRNSGGAYHVSADPWLWLHFLMLRHNEQQPVALRFPVQKSVPAFSPRAALPVSGAAAGAPYFAQATKGMGAGADQSLPEPAHIGRTTSGPTAGPLARAQFGRVSSAPQEHAAAGERKTADPSSLSATSDAGAGAGDDGDHEGDYE